MSNIAQILRGKANDLRTTPEGVAVELLKKAGMSEQDARYEVAQTVMEKQALSSLVDRGVDVEQAVKLVKAANVNVRELTTFTLAEKEENPVADILEKTANYVEALEKQIADLEVERASLYEDIEKMAQETERLQEEQPESLTKIASVGSFTNEDLEELRRINPQVLNKVASAMEEPWGLGGPVGVARPQTDPLLEFMLS